MSDPDHREAGFYWICIDGQEAEVAQWQAEWEQWLVAGSAKPLSYRLRVISSAEPAWATNGSRCAAGG